MGGWGPRGVLDQKVSLSAYVTCTCTCADIVLGHALIMMVFTLQLKEEYRRFRGPRDLPPPPCPPPPRRAAAHIHIHTRAKNARPLAPGGGRRGQPSIIRNSCRIRYFISLMRASAHTQQHHAACQHHSAQRRHHAHTRVTGHPRPVLSPLPTRRTWRGRRGARAARRS